MKPAISKLPFNSFSLHTNARTKGTCRKQNLGSPCWVDGGVWSSGIIARILDRSEARGRALIMIHTIAVGNILLALFLWWECGFRIQAIRARIRPSGPRF